MDNALGSAPPTSIVPSAPGERDYYSVSQAAALLGVSRVSIWRWISAGRLPASRLGHRTTRIKRQDLERLLDEGGTAGSRSWVFQGRGTGTEPGVRDADVAAPHANWRDMGASDHFVQFYEADAFLLDAVKDFIGATLRAGDVGIVIATPAHRVGLEDRLGAEGLDVDAARASGQYVALDAAEMLSHILVDRSPEPGRFAEIVGGLIARAAEGQGQGQRHVRVFGEMVALLAAEENHGAVVRLEELWNDLQTTHAFALFCAYPLECLDGEAGATVLGDVCAAHAHVIPAESYTALPTPDDRLRAIAVLQQQAQTLAAALAAEGAAHGEAEAARRRAEHLAAALETERDRLRAEIAERARVEEALREQTETLEAINRIGQLLSAELDLETLVQAVTDAATTLSGAQFGAFLYNVTDECGDAYQLYTISGARRDDFANLPLPRNTAIFGPTFRGEGVVRLDDVTQDPRYGLNAPYHGLPPGHLPVRSYLAAPVTVRSGAVIGGLFLGHPQPGVFTARAERLVVGLAAQAAIAMDNARLYQEAQRSIHARDEFLSAAAHDLKTPLTGIKGQAQLLRRRIARANMPEARQLAEGLTSIDQTATRLNDLINGLLDLTRLRLDRPLELERQPIDLVALVRQAVAALQPSTTRHWLRVETESTELVGSWDSSRLARVVDNLLSNAIKYSPDGGPITVCIRQEDRETQEQEREDGQQQEQGRVDGQQQEQERDATEAWAVLEVRDSGLGIPTEEVPRVFEHFQRASNVIGRIDGTGIGLASARHIVESHGGTLTVESQEGRGSTFTVRLPLTTDPMRLPLTTDPAPDSDPLPAEE